MLVDWPEAIAIIFLFIGAAMAISSANITIIYLVCLLMGIMFGRIWFRLKLTNRVPIFLAVCGFFLGYLLGSLFVNLNILILLLLLGMYVGYTIHKNKWIAV